MRKSKVIGIILICLVIGAFIFNNQLNKLTEGVGFTTSKIQKEKQFGEQVIETGLIDEIGKRLYDKGYVFSLNWNVLSKKKVEVVINLPDKKISEATKTNIEKIINGFLIESNVDPILFEIEVSNYSILDSL